MKLNADIIYDSLHKSVDLEIYGKRKRDLLLQCPKLFRPGQIFRESYVYVAFAERLPNKPQIEGCPVFICLGGKPPASYQSKCCYMVCKDTDLLHIFDMVQEIFEYFSEWSDRLQHILNTTASVQEMLDVSRAVIENPMIVLNKDFHYLAYSEVINESEGLAFLGPNADGSLRIENLARNTRHPDFNMNTVEPFLVFDEPGKPSAYAVNLFINDRCVGSFFTLFCLRPHRESDNALLNHLVKMLEKAFLHNPGLYHNYVSPLQSIIKDILDGIPVESSRMQALQPASTDCGYICVKIIQTNLSKAHIPNSYIIRQFEAVFRECIIFEYDIGFVAFISCERKTEDVRRIEARLSGQMQEMSLKGASSCPFHSLPSAWAFYRQAALALEIGCQQRPEEVFYSFSDYKLFYLLSNSIGELPLESLLSAGLQSLYEHDLASQTSYLQTLYTYLNNNMNITKTANDLYIHRSTFLERIKRIEKYLGTDLEDPDQRLYLNIILRCMNMREQESLRDQKTQPVQKSGSLPQIQILHKTEE